MAILITVFECDNCAEIVGVKTDSDWQTFEKNWWGGFYHQFCPDCRHKPEARERIAADARMILDLAEKIEKGELKNAAYAI